MRFTPENLSPPSEEFDIKQWSFTADLRDYFPDLDNNAITELLIERGVILPDDEADSESACTYIYFKTPEEAMNFIFRLDKVQEIQDYVEPIRPNPNESYIALSKTDWERIRTLIRENVSQAKRDELGEVMIFDVEL